MYMIPIVAKDHQSFLAICKYFSIDETDATFIDGTTPIVEPPLYCPPIMDVDIRMHGSDWLNYPVSK